MISPVILEKKNGIIRCLLQMGIPQFFYLAGITISFYNCERKGFFKFLKEKTLGLLIPFVVLLLVILVPRLYFAQEYEPFSRPDGQNIEWDYSKFFIGTLPSLIMKMSWLWFLLALYLDCLIVYPAV
jgi:hypothetical protein